jgi:hypothetical protein
VELVLSCDLFAMKMKNFMEDFAILSVKKGMNPLDAVFAEKKGVKNYQLT